MHPTLLMDKHPPASRPPAAVLRVFVPRPRTSKPPPPPPLLPARSRRTGLRALPPLPLAPHQAPGSSLNTKALVLRDVGAGIRMGGACHVPVHRNATFVRSRGEEGTQREAHDTHRKQAFEGPGTPGKGAGFRHHEGLLTPPPLAPSERQHEAFVLGFPVVRAATRANGFPRRARPEGAWRARERPGS